MIKVFIGRYQVTEIPQDYIMEVFNHSNQGKDDIHFIVCLSPLACSKTNPLDFETRKAMLIETFKIRPGNVHYIKDTYHDEDWSNNLDKILNGLYVKPHNIEVLGSKDTFIAHYSGAYAVSPMSNRLTFKSQEVVKKDSKQFRDGAFFTINKQYPITYPTVDIIPISSDGKSILLGRKAAEKHWRFVGGFVDPDMNTGMGALERNAAREFFEETSLLYQVDNFKYFGSFMVDDWRYKSEPDKIMTSVFILNLDSRKPTPSDDVAELKYFSISDLLNDIQLTNIVIVHKPIMKEFLSYINNINKQIEFGV